MYTDPYSQHTLILYDLEAYRQNQKNKPKTTPNSKPQTLPADASTHNNVEKRTCKFKEI